MEASNKSKSGNKSEKKDAKKHSDESKMPAYSEVDKNKDGVLTPKEFQKTKQMVAKKTAEKNVMKKQEEEEAKEERMDEADEKTEERKDEAEEKETENEKKQAEDEKKQKEHAKRHGAAESSHDKVPAPKMPSFPDVDVNGDGVLTPSEFQKERAKVIAEIEKHVSKVIKHEDHLEDLKLSLIRKIDEMPAYEDLDKDRDGVLTPAEYKTSSVTAMAKNLSYKTLDLDSDGAVTPEEFKEASETWAAEMTKQVQEKVEELRKSRDERRQLEKEIDRMQSYNDLDAKRDGVVTPAEYAAEKKASHGVWSVNNGNASAKSGASATGLGGLAGLTALVLLAL